MDNQQLSNKMEWKTVIEYDHYEVNQLGQIRHKQRKVILNPRFNAGYGYVNFNINGKRKNFAVHRIVANAFIPNPEYKPEVNHKDLNKANNNIDNLEWVSSSENKVHSYAQPTRKIAGKRINQYSKNGIFIKEWTSISEAARFMNCTVGAISNCCLGRTKTSMGYKWSFVESSTTMSE